MDAYFNNRDEWNEYGKRLAAVVVGIVHFERLGVSEFDRSDIVLAARVYQLLPLLFDGPPVPEFSCLIHRRRLRKHHSQLKLASQSKEMALNTAVTRTVGFTPSSVLHSPQLVE